MKLIHRTSLGALIIFLLSCSQLLAAPSGNPAAVLDFDGDGKTDYVVVRREFPGVDFKLVWYIRGSQRGDYAQHWGLDGWYIIPADYDGDGKWDIAVWRQSAQAYFYIWRSSDNTFQAIAWGRGDLSDNPLQTQDFDGDGKADPTVVRFQTIDGSTRMYWYSLLSQNDGVRVVHFGKGGDRPIRGDFDGDGKADLAVYRIGTGNELNYFIICRSSDDLIQFFSFGRGNDDRVLPADFDGDGKTDFTVVRSIDNAQWWFWRESSTGEVRSQQFGQYVPNVSFDNYVPGDYDGDGKTDLAIWRNIDFGGIQAYFYVAGSKDGMFVVPWGLSGTDSAPAGELQFR